MMKKWHMIIDVERCEDCNNCFLSCKDEHVDNEWPGYVAAQPRHGHRWMNIIRKERGQFPLVDAAYRPSPCMHCDSAPCIRAAKDGAVYKRKDGIVMIDPEKAAGQNELVKACPYGAIWWNEEKCIAQKCTFCAHLLDGGWKTPRCVQACPTGALRMLRCDDRQMEEIARKEGLAVLHPEYKTRPRVYYRNLYRFDRCFVAASIAVDRQGVKECVKGAAIILRCPSGKVCEAVSDAFGDFKIDGLEENSGQYTLEVEHPDFGHKTLEVEVTASVNAGIIMMNDKRCNEE